MSKPELSIIIPSYNTKDLLKKCLTSIHKNTKKKLFEIIVVDNASLDDSVKMIKRHFPQTTIVLNKENFGYGKACNQGFNKAKGKYVLFLNSDTLIFNNSLEKAIDHMEKNSQIDILGCKLLNLDKSLQQSAGFFPTLTRIFLLMFFIDDIPILKNYIKSYQQKNKDFYTKEREVDWVTGAFLLAKKKTIHKIKGFDKSIFMYAEEVDLCYRAKKKKMKVFYTPKFSIFHYKGKSSKNSLKAAILGEYQGLISFFKKHENPIKTKCLTLLLKTGAFLRIILFSVIMDKPRRRIYEKAIKLV